MKSAIAIVVLSLLSLAHSNLLHREMMNLISSQPVKEQFKLWHYIMQKSYDLNSEEAKKRFNNFKTNVKKFEEINSKNLGFTVGLGLFSDVDFSNEDSVKDIVLGMNNVESPKIVDFDLMADLDDEENDKNLQDREEDWTKLFEKDYPQIDFEPNYYNLLYCSNHSFQHGFAHTINANAKNNDVFNGRASPEFYRNCVSNNKKEDCQVTLAPQLYLQFERIPLEKNVPWTKTVGECQNPPANSYYEVKWTRCNQYTGTRCSDSVLKGFLSQGPYMSQVYGGLATLSYTGGIVTTDNCNSSSLGSIVVQITDMYVKALLPFGPKFGENGYIRIANEKIGHPEVSCGLKSYAYIPDVYFSN